LVDKLRSQDQENQQLGVEVKNLSERIQNQNQHGDDQVRDLNS